jgi:hypothetical protein
MLVLLAVQVVVVQGLVLEVAPVELEILLVNRLLVVTAHQL